ncbi:hypothetical protein, partial [Cellulomonas sp. NPDC058312]|uniref:hypothetical protein n=1 Tax=Cellulomonas sp. NPDC058312 TaxID=3346441 RepID=UPI0036EAD69E
AEYKAQVDAKYDGIRDMSIHKPTVEEARNRSAWVMFNPQGEFEGIRGLASEIRSAEEAHKKFTRLKRDREREISDGYVVRLCGPEEWQALLKNLVSEGSQR